MKVKTVNFTNTETDEANIEVLEDDNETVTTISINTKDKSENEIKQEIRDLVNAKKTKRDNKKNLKHKLEDKII